jgi:DNA replication ATP-dependent helicase Dna2
MVSSAGPKFVSPSRIARYYFQECPRYLRYSSTPQAHLEAEGVPPAPFDFRPVSTAILERGYLWEEEVIEQHLAGNVTIADADGDLPVRDRVLSVEDTQRILREMEPGEWVYQSTLVTPPAFYERYRLDPALVQVTDCRPDLIECFETDEGEVRLRVTDVKASTGLKLSHRIQATMYSLILEKVLEDWRIGDRSVDGSGGVWLSQSPEPEIFDIRMMRPPLEAFLENELQPLMAAPASDAPWHLYFRCEWCPYFEHCRDEMRSTNDVSRMPYLTSHAKRFLTHLGPPVRTVNELEDVVKDAKRVDELADCASLRGRASRIQLQAESLRTDEVKTTGGSSIAMPVGEHIQVILTLQDEPVSGQIYAYGIYAHGLKPVLGENPKPMIGIAASGDPETTEELERSFVRQLYELLAAVHEYNLDHTEWREQRTLQVYVYDSYEVKLLTDVLLRRILDPEVADQALQVFLHFQQPELIQAQDHPASEVFFPAVVLVNVLRSLFALPIEVTYRFRDVVELFREPDGFEYRVNDYFAFVLSNQMRSDAIYAIWTKGADYADRIEREIRQRLFATSWTISGIRSTLETKGAPLFAWPPKFFLPDTFAYRHTTLSRLAFLARYESVLRYLATRVRRMAPLEEQLRNGDTLRLTYKGDDRFELDPRHRDLDIDAGGFPSWILVEEDDAGRRARLSYHDYANRKRMFVPKNLPLALTSIMSVESTDEHPNVALHLDVKPSSTMPELRSGRPYVLGPRMTDYTTDHAINALRDADLLEPSNFAELLESPLSFASKVALPDEVRRDALSLGKRYGMTTSQLATFDGVIDHRLRLVWGPPGTGKTHFLALAVLCLAEAHLKAKRPFRVLVTAFTHAAIDNCLRKVAQLNADHGIVTGVLPIAKLGKRTLPDMHDVSELVDKGWNWPAQPMAVFGGTVWALRKGVDDAVANMVVIDEGSQLEVPPAVLAVKRLASDGRLLIAGDHRQLPPIIQGSYPDPGEGEPLLHRSLFECLRDQDVDGAFTGTLLENFRMNEALCRYPAAQIYVPEYQSATAAIAARSLALAPPDQIDPLVEALVDPSHPLVVGVLEGVQATAENLVEADLVAQAAVALRSRLRDAHGKLYPDGAPGDAAFWKYGLFIVSPHHAQIHAVRRALAERRAWQTSPFVDTVDKMQGQECDAVIATYGVSDVEYAMNEKEFIYSLNRLNVSITRARAKTIVFLPKPLIEPPIAAFEDDRIAEGIAFMQGLVRFAEQRGERTEYVLERGATLHLMRMPMTALGAA